MITSNPLAEGSLVECEAFGLLEMFEDGESDHQLFATWSETRIEIKGILPTPR
ncbi:MAG TPA: hypothetical protein VMV44_00455 [Rectinemataceae bacterium]|nr:hypothetical protein [Rectinemataceae bacterium]